MANIIQTATIICGDIDASGEPIYRFRAPEDLTIVGLYLTGGTNVQVHGNEIHVGTPWSVILAPAVYLEVDECEVLEYRPTEVGTGNGDISGATLQIDYYIRQGIAHSHTD